MRELTSEEIEQVSGGSLSPVINPAIGSVVLTVLPSITELRSMIFEAYLVDLRAAGSVSTS